MFCRYNAKFHTLRQQPAKRDIATSCEGFVFSWNLKAFLIIIGNILIGVLSDDKSFQAVRQAFSRRQKQYWRRALFFNHFAVAAPASDKKSIE